MYQPAEASAKAGNGDERNSYRDFTFSRALIPAHLGAFIIRAVLSALRRRRETFAMAGQDAAPARGIRNPASGTPRVTVRRYYDRLPLMAGLGRAKEVKASGSGPRISRSARVQEARSRGAKSPPVERREAWT